MITRQQVAGLMQRPEASVPVLSVYLDVRTGADHRRGHEVFLAERRRHCEELAALHPDADAVELQSVLERVGAWLRDELQPASEGVALFAEVGGAWFEAYQLPVPLPNRASLGSRPAVAPLLHALQGRRLHTVACVDRERLRLLAVWLGEVVEEEVTHAHPFAAHTETRMGGARSHQHQQHRLEEDRHHFAGFAAALGRFAERTGAESVVLVGTDANVARLRRALAPETARLVAGSAAMAADAPIAQVLARLAPTLDAGADGDEMVHRLRERASTGYMAATGMQHTLSALQNGKAEAALLPDGGDSQGARCTRCGFLFSGTPEACPFDGAPVEPGVAVVEEAIRLAAAQGALVRLAPPEATAEFAGAGALLRF